MGFAYSAKAAATAASSTPSGWPTGWPVPTSSAGPWPPGFAAASMTAPAGLYAGGSFTSLGVSATAANYIARWSGTAWSALGSGMDSTVYALANLSGNLIAGGAFTTAGGSTANRVASWNGAYWSALGTGFNNIVYALAVSGSTLYAAGAFTTADGASATRVASWNGTAWSAMGSGLDGDVYALAMHGGTLYAAGAFTGRVASWNGTAWSVVGSLSANLTDGRALLSSTDLYLTGSAGTVAAGVVNTWNGTTWTANADLDLNTDGRALASFGGSVYVGGYFARANGGTPNEIPYGIGKIISSTRVAPLSGDYSGINDAGTNFLSAMATFQSKLYFAGSFATFGRGNSTTPAGEFTANGVGVWDGTSFFTHAELATGAGTTIGALLTIS